MCLFSTNQGVTHVTGRVDGGKEMDESTKEAQGLKDPHKWLVRAMNGFVRVFMAL